MSEYYNANRTKNLFDPLRHGSGQAGQEAFKLSRSKIDNFLNCPRCFYLDRRLGVGQPPGYPFNLNSAVDKLLKKEFDIHRASASAHPLMKHYKIDAVPFNDKRMEDWRNNFKGIQFLHEPTSLLVYGAIDDVWVSPSGELMIVDYKATSKSEEVTLDADWQIGYKRQMEIYEWLFRQNGFKVSDTGYFVYCNGKADKDAFDGKLEFDVKIIPYTGKTDWIEDIIFEIKKCLMSDEIPEADPDCDYCNYREAAKKVEGL